MNRWTRSSHGAQKSCSAAGGTMTRKSHASASEKPAPAATPLTALWGGGTGSGDDGVGSLCCCQAGEYEDGADQAELVRAC
jgi:hypothetical protein